MKNIVHNLIVHTGSVKLIPIGKGNEVQNFNQLFSNREHFRIIAGGAGEILNIKWVSLDKPPPKHGGNFRLQNGN